MLMLEEKDFRKKKQQKKEGRKIEYTEKQKSHMDRDGTFTAKHNQVHFGYKNHVKTDIVYHLTLTVGCIFLFFERFFIIFSIFHSF